MHTLIIALAVLLPATALAGVRLELDHGGHHDDSGYQQRAGECRTMGGYMRHGQCRYSHRYDHNGDHYYGGQRYREDY
jgi:hypothetical protein